MVHQSRNLNIVSVNTPIAELQVSRSGRPTKADTPNADDPPVIHPSEPVSEDQKPENLALKQATDRVLPKSLIPHEQNLNIMTSPSIDSNPLTILPSLAPNYSGT